MESCLYRQLLLLVLLASQALAVEDEQCEQTGDAAVPDSNLLQIHAIGPYTDKEESVQDSKPAQIDNFGPGACVGLKRSITGSCVLRTQCKDQNISQQDFAFVCFNPGASMPHALHSFGRGGFKKDESFDTKVHCKECMSVDTAFRTGGSVVRNALAALPLSRLPSLSGAVKGSTAYSATELAQIKPKEAAVFGPSYCISTFLAPAGTCLIRTRCAGVDMSKFNVGVTCLDKSGGYTRYLFGKDEFKPEETFDTLITCQSCIGVGPESSLFAMHGLMPRKLVDDVTTLKMDVQTLNEKVRVLQDAGSKGAADKHSDWPRHSKDEPMGPLPTGKPGHWKKKNHNKEEEADPMGPMPGHPDAELLEEAQADSPLASQDQIVPTVVLARRQSAEALADVAVVEEVAEDSGAETAVVDVGPMQMVTHRRPGAAIAEILRRVSNGARPDPTTQEDETQ